MSYKVQALALRALIAAIRPLPVAWRMRVVGALGRLLVRLVPSIRRRAEDNLALVWPEMPTAARRALALDAGNQAGRQLASIWFSRDVARVWRDLRAEGPGLEALRAADRDGRPVIAISGHFGAFDAFRHAIRHEGLEFGALYRVNNNPHYDPIFREGLEIAGGPILPRGRAGMRGMLRHLRSGGKFALLVDQAMEDGVELDFLGHPARTSTAAAELALRHDAPLVPVFVPVVDGRPAVEVDEPIPPGDPAAMMAAFNDRLAARVRAHPSQWYWFHRRWKTYR